MYSHCDALWHVPGAFAAGLAQYSPCLKTRNLEERTLHRRGPLGCGCLVLLLPCGCGCPAAAPPPFSCCTDSTGDWPCLVCLAAAPPALACLLSAGGPSAKGWPAPPRSSLAKVSRGHGPRWALAVLCSTTVLCSTPWLGAGRGGWVLNLPGPDPTP